MKTSYHSSVPDDRGLLGDVTLTAAGTGMLALIIFVMFSELSPASRTDQQPQNVIGELSRSTNLVRRRADDTLVWNLINTGATIQDGDAVYAGANSDALISLADGSQIEVDENSMVIVRQPAHRPQDAIEASTPNVAVEVLRGSATGKTGSQGMAIQLGVASMALENNSTANVRLRQDRSARIEVGRGRAVVKTEREKKKALSAGQRQQIDQTGKALSIQVAGVVLETPEAGKRLFFTQDPPAIEFRWSPPRRVGACLFELGHDAEFEKTNTSRLSSGTNLTVSGLDAGVYFWRVRCGRGMKKLISQERRLVLIADTPPLPYRPRAGEVVYLESGTTIPFAWSTVPDVGTYTLEVMRGKELAISTQVLQPSYLYQAPPEEASYCFRVRSAEAERGGSPWSDWSCFRTITQPLPRAPKLYDPKIEVVPPEKTPSDRQKGSWLWWLLGSVAYAQEAPERAIVLRWEAIPGVTNYVIEIAEDQAFTKVVMRERVPHNYYRLHTLTQRSLFWRVKSIDAAGRDGEFSQPKEVGAVLWAPRLLSPDRDAKFEWINQPPEIWLRWEGSELLASYLVEITQDPDFSEPPAFRQVGGKPHFLFLAPGLGRFYWRVSGIAPNGQTTKKSSSFSFEVLPSAPNLVRPEKGATISWQSESLQVQLAWEKRPVASYLIELARDSAFRRQVIRLKRSTTTATFQPDTAGTFYWRVRGANPDSTWSQRSAFRVVPAAPRLSSPANGASLLFAGEPISLELAWQAVPKASAYLVEIESTGQKHPTGKPLRVNHTSTTIGNLPAGRYVWYVRSVHPSGEESPPSEKQTFELAITRPKPPPAPALSSPSDGEEMVFPDAKPVGLSWQPVKEASSYEIELSVSDEFSPTLDQRKVQSTGISLSVPPQKKTFWRVRALDREGGAGAWSRPRHFSYRVVPVEISAPRPSEPVVYLAPRLAFFYNLGEITTARYDIEIGARLPIWERRLGVSLAVGYYTATATASEPGTGFTAESRLHAIPIDLVATYRFFTSFADLYLGAGVNFDLTFANISMPTQPELRQTDFLVGFVALGGIERALGPGAAFMELSFALTTKAKDLLEIDPGGLAVGAGYRIGLW